MAFNLGDFVRFLDEKREGYITRLVDDLTVGVTDSDGFEIPVAKNNLTHVHGHQVARGGQSENATMPVEATFVGEGIYLAVAEEGKTTAVAHFYIINKTSYQIMLTLTSDFKGKYRGEFAGTIQPKTVSQVYTVNLGDLDNWPTFVVQGLFFTQANKAPKLPLVYSKKFKAKDLSHAKRQIAEINKYGWDFWLDEPAPVIDAAKLKESMLTPKSQQHVIAKPADEIDLHLEKLRDDYQFLGQSEMLDMQLAHFKKMLDAAIVHQMPSIVFIHGVGNGTLRHHIHQHISKHPQVRTFMDAQKEKFGYGATKVVFKV